MNIVLLITLISIISLIVERIVIAQRVDTIHHRIHVNGTRGKSTVAQYIGAVLSASNKKCYTKITGIVPTLYFPDGSSQTIRRRGKARLQEQFSIISRAAKNRGDALVLECMSLKPEYQKLESLIFLPHITVITNIEDDHREEMGPTDEERVGAIASSIPYSSVVFTSDSKHFSVLQQHADERKTKIFLVDPLSNELASQLPKESFPINVALAISVSSYLGIDEKIAFEAIKNLEVKNESIETTVNGFVTRFINGFAVNDVPSVERFVCQWEKEQLHRKKIIILNTRNDRPLRTVEFIKWCASMKDIYHIFITGTHADYALRSLKKTSRTEDSYSLLHISDIPLLLQKIICAETDIFGIGNIAGEGFEIIEYFNKRVMAEQW